MLLSLLSRGALQRRRALLLALCVSVVAGGCRQLFVGVPNQSFTVTRSEPAAFAPLDAIGIAVLSDGPVATYRRYRAERVWMRYAAPVTNTGTLRPDTLLAGPSLELALNLRTWLRARSFTAEVLDGVEQQGEVEVSKLIELARRQGYQACLVVSYKGYTAISEASNEFRYVPQAALFETSGNETVWTFTNYGVPDNEVDEENLVGFVNDALDNCAGDNYFEAAAATAREIFAPSTLEQHYVPFPSRWSGGRF